MVCTAHWPGAHTPSWGPFALFGLVSSALPQSDRVGAVALHACATAMRPAPGWSSLLPPFAIKPTGTALMHAFSCFCAPSKLLSPLLSLLPPRACSLLPRPPVTTCH
ncbi:MAG: hypothetical protein J3K34DRAFT_380736, partial [Monoraphidium minutum]